MKAKTSTFSVTCCEASDYNRLSSDEMRGDRDQVLIGTSLFMK